MFQLQDVTALSAALGIGLLVGIERERNKGTGPTRDAAGLRTFALIALTGAVSALIGGVGIAVAGAFIAFAALASYRHSRTRDPGLTTEVAMLMVFLLGVLSMREVALAAALGVVVTALLAAKTRLHHWVRQSFSAPELHDALLIAAAAAIVLPLLPDRGIDPWHVLNPRKLWLLAVLVMVINAAGHVGLRMFGARLGLLLAGFAGGFVSSTATIASMGSKARAAPQMTFVCAGAGVLSNVSTVIQLAVVTGALSSALLRQIALPLLAAGAAAAAFSLLASWRSGRAPSVAGTQVTGRAFQPGQVFLFVGIVSAVMLLSAVAMSWLGDSAVVWTLAVSGLADVHAAAASAAQFVALGQIDVATAKMAVLLAFIANSIVKLVVAFAAGGRAYGLRLLPGIVSMLAAFALVALLY